MDGPPLLPPPRYRLEHRHDDLAPLILGFYRRKAAALSALQLACFRLRADGIDGVVVVIDQSVNPEVETDRCGIRQLSHSNETQS